MLTFSNTNTVGAQAAISQAPLVVQGSSSGNTLGVCHFRPTAMDLFQIDGVTPNPVSYPSQRTASVCFMRGLSENIRIETSSGNPWFHRRICFAAKNNLFLVPNPADPSGTERSQLATGLVKTSNGYQRLAGNMMLDTLTATMTSQLAVLFKGAQGVDWDDFITAPIDTARVDLKFDKTWVYKSGNERGILRETKLWHSMNKNIYYDEDEVGAGETVSTNSVQDKRGMGDYHVFDLFSQGSSGSSTDLLKVRFTSQMYWHEK